MNSNTVEFVLRMKDLMSSSFNKLGSTSQSTFSRMARNAEQVNQQTKQVSNSYKDLERNIKSADNAAKNSSFGKGMGKGGIAGGVALGTMVAGIAMQAGTAFIDVVKSGIGTAISGSMQKEKDLIGLSTFLGKQGANDAYANIRQDAQVTPYDTKSLLSVNRALVSTGLSAKEAREDTMNLANAISATGGGTDELMRMAVNMQQIRAAGKATGLDIKQFAYAGINIYEMLAKSTGKSVAEVKDMEISYDQLAKALAVARSKGGIYEGALEAMGKSRAGRLESIKDQAYNALTDLGDAMSPMVILALEIGQQIINQITPGIQKITPFITFLSNGFGEAVNFLSQINISTSDWTGWLEIAKNNFFVTYGYLKSIFTTTFKIVGGIMEWLVKSELVKDSFRILFSFIHKIYGNVESMGQKLLWLHTNILMPILNSLESAYVLIKHITGNDAKTSVHVTKTLATTPKPVTAPSYSADLTRFGNSTIAATDTKATKNKEKSKSTGDTISGGGPKTINITLGKFFDTIQFTTLNGSESAERLEAVVLEALGRVLYNGAKVM